MMLMVTASCAKSREYTLRINPVIRVISMNYSSAQSEREIRRKEREKHPPMRMAWGVKLENSCACSPSPARRSMKIIFLWNMMSRHALHQRHLSPHHFHYPCRTPCPHLHIVEADR